MVTKKGYIKGLGEGVMKFKPKVNKYIFEEFSQELSNHIEQTGQEIRILAFISRIMKIDNLLEELEYHGFTVQKMGEIVKLTKSYRLYYSTIQVTYYMYYHPELKIILLFTENNVRDINATITKFKKIKNIYELWIPPYVFEGIKDFILEENDSYIINFLSERYDNNKNHITNCIRPHIKRKISYKGKDGKDAIEEMKLNYGVLPKMIEFVIPDIAKFKINDNGMFTIRYGTINFLIDTIIEKLLKLLSDTLNSIEKSKLEVIKNENREELQMVQLKIVLRRELTYDNINSFIDKLNEDSFSIYSQSIRKGSILFSSFVTDELKNNIFSLTTNGKEMHIIPKFGATFDSLLRFFQFVINSIDPEARCEKYDTI